MQEPQPNKKVQDRTYVSGGRPPLANGTQLRAANSTGNTTGNTTNDNSRISANTNSMDGGRGGDSAKRRGLKYNNDNSGSYLDPSINPITNSTLPSEKDKMS
jgi:hypothetical protein